MDVSRAANLFTAIASPFAGRFGTSRPKIPWDTWDGYAKTVVDGQEYAIVGKRLYSEHAVNRMQPSGLRSTTGANSGGMPQIRQGSFGDYGRGVAPQYVEDAINTSTGVRQANGNISHASGSLQVILSPEGRVVTIITH